jgi:hypothetical protein
MALPQRPNQLNPYPTAFAPIVNPKPALDTDSIDFESRIQAELQSLSEAVDSYQADKDKTGQSKTEQAILAARQEFHRISAELTAAKLRLEALQAAGSALDLYNGAVNRVEGGFQKIVELYQSKVQSQVVEQWFGGKVDLSRLSKERRNDLKLHARVAVLRAFTYLSQYKANSTQAEIEKRVDAVGEKLIDLRAHIVADKPKKA